ncbi:hypothetical protein NAS92_02325 [Pantoea brenneri]|uniref:BRO family protein n=1 Tax=Pantoea brenneri TaxID=472694 RepID=UPI002108D58B|nr:BRO family protein [Pantoea brenneri]MCQ5469314.1 hypothetical protein [Pantoea brenneri]
MMFAGVEMDVVIGHPEHELLFVGAQVERAAGLTKGAAKEAMKRNAEVANGVRYKELKRCTRGSITLLSLTDALGKSLRSDAWLIAEPTVYGMLLRGHSTQSEPFRKWVTEEVLPSIRKTGQYEIAKSITPEAIRK